MASAETFLSAAEREAVNRAVAAAEKHTSGEIVPVVASESGRYDRAEDIGGLVFAVLALTAAWTWGQRIEAVEGDWAHGQRLTLGLPWVVLTLVAGFIVGAFLTSRLAWLRRGLATDREMREEVQQRAWEAFARFRIGGTQHGTGILIYISLFERMVCVLGDEPIAKKIEQQSWDEVRDMILSGIRGRQPGDGLCRAVARCGELLGQHFPIRPGDVNELPNELRILP
jgi:putative membrane protein